MNLETHIPVMETFTSLQGEGHYQGTKAFFLRFAGCDVGCHWCDVKESWAVDDKQWRSYEEVLEEADQSNSEIIVVTGGEPCTYPLDQTTKILQKTNKALHLETSGAYPITGNWDWVCLSPKKFKACLEPSFHLADELKVVIYNKHDLNWALELSEKVKPECLLFLQPEWSKEKESIALIEDFQKEHKQWESSIQIHKYLGLR